MAPPPAEASPNGIISQSACSIRFGQLCLDERPHWRVRRRSTADRVRLRRAQQGTARTGFSAGRKRDDHRAVLGDPHRVYALFDRRRIRREDRPRDQSQHCAAAVADRCRFWRFRRDRDALRRTCSIEHDSRRLSLVASLAPRCEQRRIAHHIDARHEMFFLVRTRIVFLKYDLPDLHQQR